MFESQFEWNRELECYKPKGFNNKPQPIMFQEKKEKSMSNDVQVQEYELTRKNGRVDKVRFTAKRGEILELLKQGLTNEEVVAKGYSKHTVPIVRWQALKVGALTEEKASESVA